MGYDWTAIHCKDNKVRSDLELIEGGASKPLTEGIDNGKSVAVDGSITVEEVFAGWDNKIWNIPTNAFMIQGRLPGFQGIRSISLPKMPGIAPNPRLSDLKVSAGTLSPSFYWGIYTYRVSVGAEVSSIAVTPFVDQEKVTISIDDKVINSGETSELIALPTKQNIISIHVSAGNYGEKDYTITVEREIPAYTVKVLGGSADAESYDEGATVNITADTPDNGKEFVKWTSEPAVVFADEADPTTTFPMPAEDVEIKAVFEQIPVTGVRLDQREATLYTNAEPRTITLSATVEPDGAFDRSVTWVSSAPAVAKVEDGVVTALAAGTAEITVTTVDGGHTDTCVVTVKEQTHDITIEQTAGGTVSASAASAKEGDTVTLTAEPARGYRFKEWVVDGGGVTVDGDSFLMPGHAVTVKAVFEAVTHEIVVKTEGSGTAEADPASAKEGDAVSLAAEPGDGYRFKAWTTDSEGVHIMSAENPSASFEMPDHAVTVTAVFEELPPETIDVTGVGLEPESVTLYTNKEPGTMALTYEVAPADATNKAVTWESSDPTVATVTGGVVTALAAGEAVITVTTVDGRFTARCAVTVETVPEPSYTVTVQPAEGGTASASPASAKAGETVTLTAVPDSGSRFKEWVVVSGDVEIVDGRFTMPAGDVTVKAVFEEIPAERVPVTGVALDRSSADLWTNADPRAVTLKATVAPAGATDKTVTWTTSDPAVAEVTDGVVTAKAKGTATITATTADGGFTARCAVTVSTQSGGSSGGGGGGSASAGGPKPSIVKTGEAGAHGPVTAAITVKATADSKGNGKVTVPGPSVASAIKLAEQERKKTADSQGGIAVQVNVAAGGKNIRSAAVTLPNAVLEQVADSGAEALILSMEQPGLELRLDLAAVEEIRRQAGGDVVLTAALQEDLDGLTEAAQAALGGRPLISLTAAYDGGKGTVSGFGTGRAVIGLPYDRLPEERPGRLCAVYVDGEGQPSCLLHSVYDEGAGVLRFSTGHFSLYGVGYRSDAPEFDDLDGHWAAGAVEFAAARGLFNGAEAGRFSPDEAMTRGMLMAVLGRMEEADVSGYDHSGFADVAEDAYYMGYVAWAAEQGISKGVGGGRFAPDRDITRQELAAILVGYAQAVGTDLPRRVPETAFTDGADISPWAAEAVEAMQRAALLEGRDDGRFDPQGTATRAEVCALLQRLVELGIDG